MRKNKIMKKINEKNLIKNNENFKDLWNNINHLIYYKRRAERKL